jgi:hypothetical protein
LHAAECWTTVTRESHDDRTQAIELVTRSADCLRKHGLRNAFDVQGIKGVFESGIRKLQVNPHDTWWSEDRIPQIAKIDNAFAADAAWTSKFYRDQASIIVDWIVQDT